MRLSDDGKGEGGPFAHCGESEAGKTTSWRKLLGCENYCNSERLQGWLDSVYLFADFRTSYHKVVDNLVVEPWVGGADALDFLPDKSIASTYDADSIVL
jgi:hypothetical protein